MQNTLATIGVALIWSGCAFAESGSQSQQITVIQNVRVFDGERMIEEATVVLRDTAIVEVAEGPVQPEAAPGSERIDGDGMTLMPGLIDAHTHTFSRAALERALDFGVTTTVDMWTSVEFVQAIQAERMQGVAVDRADMYTAGIGVTAPKSHGTQFGPVPTLTDPGGAEEFVAARVAEGSEFIKIIYDNFKMIDRPIPTLDYSTLEATISAAHRQDRLAVVHSRDVEAFADAVRAGADGIVHAPVDQVPDERLIAALRDNGVFVIPTLSISTPSGSKLAEDVALGPRLSPDEIKNLRNYRPMHRSGGDRIAMDSVRALKNGGVTILAGSDSPNLGTATGVSIHQEMQMLVESGLSPVEALVAATSAPADAFGLKDRGRVRTGCRADLVLVEGDPGSSIVNTRRIVAVWKAGRRHNPAE
jgi:imidazolonepropionase-like amidohydrolase